MTRPWRIAYRLRYVTLAFWSAAVVFAAFIGIEPYLHWSGIPQPLHDWLWALRSCLGPLDELLSYAGSPERTCAVAGFFLGLLAAVRIARISTLPARPTLPFRLGAALAATLLVAIVLAWCVQYRPVRWRLGGLSQHAEVLESQLVLYRAQHNNEFPPVDRIWQCMLQTTNADHAVSESGRFGPYLQLQSINPLTGGSTIRADSSGDWRFDPQTGRLVAFAPMCPEIVLLHETRWWPEHLELRLDQPAGDVMGLVTAQVFMDELAAMARPQWSSGNAMFAGLCLLVGALFFIRCSRWLRNGDALLRSVATLLTMAATAALLLGGALLMWDQHLDAYRMVVCSLGFVVLWAGGVLLHVQFAARQHDRFRNPTICTQCAYDLRGTLAAGRHECPECGKQAA